MFMCLFSPGMSSGASGLRGWESWDNGTPKHVGLISVRVPWRSWAASKESLKAVMLLLLLAAPCFFCLLRLLAALQLLHETTSRLAQRLLNPQNENDARTLTAPALKTSNLSE